MMFRKRNSLSYFSYKDRIKSFFKKQKKSNSAVIAEMPKKTMEQFIIEEIERGSQSSYDILFRLKSIFGSQFDLNEAQILLQKHLKTAQEKGDKNAE